MMDAAELRDFIRTYFTHSAFRWEILPTYEVASDGSDYGRYLAGHDAPTPERKKPWLDRLASERARGLKRSRVRLLHSPLTDYERYECEWGYVPNAAAGEDIRIIYPPHHRVPVSNRPDHDFWLIDDRYPIRMHYTETGEFEGATIEPVTLPYYRRARDQALAWSHPFSDWWASHPEFHRDRYRKAA